MAHPLMHENIWFDKWRYDDAEVAYQMGRAAGKSSEICSQSSIASEIARAREQIHKSLQMDSVKVSDGSDSSGKLASLTKENSALKEATDDLWTYVKKLEARIESLEKKSGSTIATTSTVPASPAASKELAQPKKETAPEKDDDFDLFGDEEEEEDSEEKKRQTEERLKLYEAKKAGKTALIAKSCVILDVKPWDDETDMKAMETNVRTIEMDGLVWGAAKLIPLAYGIHKLQISCVVEDEKVSVDELQEKIESFEDYVQSVDIAAFNKL